MFERATDLEQETETSPTVTVALPVLDEEQHLEAALDSIADQTYPFIMEVLLEGVSSS